MRTIYELSGERLRAIPEAELEAGRKAVWVDLHDPTTEDEAFVERRFGIRVPSEEEMQEIELSSRLYEDGGTLVMTITALTALDQERPRRAPITFALREGVLASVRRAEPKPFLAYVGRATKPKGAPCETGELVMVGLLEALVDRLADALEAISGGIDELSHEVFRRRIKNREKQTRDLEAMINKIGRKSEVLGLIQESLVSLSRLAAYYMAQEDEAHRISRQARQRLKLLQRDAAQLTEYALFLADKTAFLLDATLGLITLEQNQIIKIFSIVSVVFMPPTLVASIYGMNFDRMPELQWTFGYPMALGLMVLFAILPFVFFKTKGWL